MYYFILFQRTPPNCLRLGKYSSQVSLANVQNAQCGERVVSCNCQRRASAPGRPCLGVLARDPSEARSSIKGDLTAGQIRV
jgi:hypothetical protein